MIAFSGSTEKPVGPLISRRGDERLCEPRCRATSLRDAAALLIASLLGFTCRTHGLGSNSPLARKRRGSVELVRSSMSAFAILRQSRDISAGMRVSQERAFSSPI